MSNHALQQPIEELWERRESLSPSTKGVARDAVDAALELMDAGTARVAEPTANGWQVNQWLKKAVLLSFRLTDSTAMQGPGGTPVWDKVPLKFAGWGENRFREAGFRAVPGAVVRRAMPWMRRWNCWTRVPRVLPNRRRVAGRSISG